MTAPLTPEDDALHPDDLDEVLAAETALGLLEGSEAREIAERLTRDGLFAARVRGWQERLAGLALHLTPVMPPAGARQRIKERLGHAHQPLAVDPTERPAWWRGPLGVLTGLAFVTAIAVLLWLPDRQPAGGPEAAGYQAQLASADQELRATARLEGRDLDLTLTDGTPAPDRVFEAWWIADDGAAPVSLGVVPPEGELRLTLPEGLMPDDTVQIALSEEPDGGSPTGQVTGPVVAIAPLTRL